MSVLNSDGVAITFFQPLDEPTAIDGALGSLDGKTVTLTLGDLTGKVERVVTDPNGTEPKLRLGFHDGFAADIPWRLIEEIKYL